MCFKEDGGGKKLMWEGIYIVMLMCGHIEHIFTPGIQSNYFTYEIKNFRNYSKYQIQHISKFDINNSS